MRQSAAGVSKIFEIVSKRLFFERKNEVTIPIISLGRRDGDEMRHSGAVGGVAAVVDDGGVAVVVVVVAR